VLNDTDSRTLPIAIALFQGQHSTSWGLVFAASIVAVVPVLLLYVIFQRYFVAGITSGALKS
jgi:multiple sugar transport system permease protein